MQDHSVEVEYNASFANVAGHPSNRAPANPVLMFSQPLGTAWTHDPSDYQIDTQNSQYYGPPQESRNAAYALASMTFPSTAPDLLLDQPGRFPSSMTTPAPLQYSLYASQWNDMGVAYPATSQHDQETASIAPEQQSPPAGARSIKCPRCSNFFDRYERAESCNNAHLGKTPYECRGQCNKPGVCLFATTSAEYLRAHVYKRWADCPACGKRILKKNITRHISTSCRKTTT